MSNTGSLSDRYAINDAAVDWSMAEAQVSKLANGDPSGKSTIVTVKSTTARGGVKRKAEVEEGGGKDKEIERKGGARRSIKKARR